MAARCLAIRSATAYDRGVRSVADQLEIEDRARMAALSPEARVALSLRLGEEALAILCAARGLARTEARALAHSLRSAGRRQAAPATG